ncbi:MAG: GNAT family N-acetyltransferase [Acidobacteria bacterium]|nr:GNAT family N-acetyltransferase [Acidobacteriota bacterium]
MIETLETVRLLLRQWKEEDFDEYARICADAEVMRFLGGKPFNRLEAWRHMAFLVGHWQLRGFGHWAVEEKSSGRLIGRMGFLHPDGWPDFEVGWTLARECWGRGYATEAARRMLDCAFNEMDRDHVISLIHPDNRASINVAEKMGERVEGRTEIFGFPVLIYGISRDEWRKREITEQTK